MSWPSTDFECEIQQQINDLEDEVKELKAVGKAWSSRSKETKKIVLDDLRGMQSNWAKAADEADGKEDAETLKIIIKLLETLDRK